MSSQENRDHAGGLDTDARFSITWPSAYVPDTSGHRRARGLLSCAGQNVRARAAAWARPDSRRSGLLSFHVCSTTIV